MTPDWIFVCALAKVFHIEDQGNELWLVRHDTGLVDGPIEFPVGSGNIVNIPFRPHVLWAKAPKKEAAETFRRKWEMSLAFAKDSVQALRLFVHYHNGLLTDSELVSKLSELSRDVLESLPDAPLSSERKGIKEQALELKATVERGAVIIVGSATVGE